jgi:hypothetical protein
MMNFKFFLLAFVMMIASPVWADWVEIAVSEKGVKSHIDPTTVRKNGNFSIVWTMDNFPKAQNIGGVKNARSFRSRMEYDCKTDRMRSLSVSAHSEQNARGETLGQQDFPTHWADIPPNSIGITIFNLVCP